MNQSNIKSRNRGFTLLELMIVVAIIGILGAIAYPSYQESVKTSRRSDAIAALLEQAHRAERIYATTGSYTTFSIPAGTKSDEGFYNISTSAASTASTFAIQAAATGSQSGDKCGTLTLNQTGAKNVTGADSGVTADDCW